GSGVNVVFDPVGGTAFDAASRRMARNGRLLVIGFASGTIPSLPVNLALVKEYSVIGVFWGNFTRAEPDIFAANMHELFNWYAKGVVKPVIEGRYPLSQAAEQLERMRTRDSSGKIVLVPDD
ncbi:MAG TPA: zinc-binding dehydrogenase, partial [Pararhizobium sp.]|nr:zinc-binding dehydrogenase [Pararhizobium sp.]